jgi:purine-binding chemotaxis protein CheW
MTQIRDFSTFWVGNHHLAVEAALVQEVIPRVPCTAVPQTNPEVDGLINLRGQIVLAINLHRRLALDESQPSPSQANLIVHTHDGLISLRVDQLGDVIPLDQDRLEPIPRSVRGELRELALGVFLLEDSLLIQLDVSQVATHEACIKSER